MESTLTKILTVAAGLGVSATLLVYLVKKYREEEYLIGTIQTSRQSVLKIKVPKASIGAIIGRGGAMVKKIQNATNTKIQFGEDENDEGEETVIIRGVAKDLSEAERLVMKVVSDAPVVEVYEMYVPQQACGMIIGRNGDNIRLICQSSQAKVVVDRAPYSHDKSTIRRVTIKGSLSQIATAKGLIEEKVILAESKQDNHVGSNKSNNDGQPLLSITSHGDDTKPYKPEKHQVERLIPTSGDGFLEVFVSAVEHPSHFWVQIVSARAKELDIMVEELTEYYSCPNNQKLHVLEEVKVGDYVAAPFDHDQKWYRGRIDYVEEESYSTQDKKITVYYVDFGDSEDMTLRNVRGLSEKYLQLPFQAIECTLARVEPKGGKWEEEGIQLFEQLTSVANWISIMAKPTSQPESADELIPVELVDTHGAKDVGIAGELVEQGFADWVD